MVALERTTAPSPAVRLVLSVLALHTNPRLEAHPGAARLSVLTGLAESTVHAALADLKARGEIVVAQAGGGRGRARVWRLALCDDEFELPENTLSVGGTNPPLTGPFSTETLRETLRSRPLNPPLSGPQQEEQENKGHASAREGEFFSRKNGASSTAAQTERLSPEEADQMLADRINGPLYVPASFCSAHKARELIAKGLTTSEQCKKRNLL